MSRRFFTLDVFTDHALAGNPLAVVLDSDGLDDRHMPAKAREFNLSETVFVGAPTQPDRRAGWNNAYPTRLLAIFRNAIALGTTGYLMNL